MPACRRLASIAFQPVLMLYPPQKGRVSHAAAPFSQPCHPVSKTQLKAQIPTNTQDHDFLVEVPTFEPLIDWYESRHLSIRTPRPFAPEPYSSRFIQRRAVWRCGGQ